MRTIFFGAGVFLLLGTIDLLVAAPLKDIRVRLLHKRLRQRRQVVKTPSTSVDLTPLYQICEFFDILAKSQRFSENVKQTLSTTDLTSPENLVSFIGSNGPEQPDSCAWLLQRNDFGSAFNGVLGNLVLSQPALTPLLQPPRPPQNETNPVSSAFYTLLTGDTNSRVDETQKIVDIISPSGWLNVLHKVG